MMSIRQKSELDTCEPEAKDDILSVEEVTEADVEDRAPVATVSMPNTFAIESAASESGRSSRSSRSSRSETVPVVSPRLRRQCPTSLNFTMMQREQDRKDREMEMCEERKRKEDERKREEEDRIFRNMFLAAIMQDKNVKPDGDTK